MTRISLQEILVDALAIGLDRTSTSKCSADRDGARKAQASTSSRDHPIDRLETQWILADPGSDWVFGIECSAGGVRVSEWPAGTMSAIPTRPPPRDGKSADPIRRVLAATLSEEDREAVSRHFSRALQHGSDRFEFRLRFPDAEMRWLASSLRVISGAEPSGVRFIYGTMRDITKQRETEEALRRSESQYRALVEQTSDGIVVLEESGRVMASNSAAHELFGLDERELHRKRFEELFHPDDLDRDPLILKNLVSRITLRSVRRMKREGDSEWVWVELSACRLQDGRVQVTARDITARIEAERRIRRLAYFDSLTGLPNRALFRERIEQAIERCKHGDKRLALLFLDIDRFKQVNDSLGRSSGDALLIQIADRLRAALRGGDSVSRRMQRDGMVDDRCGVIARLGGDEFTILIQELGHPQDAARVARRVLHSLSRPFTVSDQEVFAGCSIGIAVWPEDGADSELLLRSADTAMYHAKGHGGNSYEFFSSSMNVVSMRRLNVETRLRRALERNEFSLVYQPIRDAQSGRTSAAEALLRWVDSDGESIGPDEFIPIAEESGLIVEIGAWVLQTACQQARDWQAEGYAPFRLSVNISVGQLRNLGIVETVDQILYETGLSPGRLELEITETSILDSDPNIVAAVSRLTDMGIGFALDDFGTGYSSLSALQRFPIERLKIDRSFVAGVDENKNDQTLTSAIVALAKRLGQKVVAEGVETEGQARFLIDLGCDELQGYLFSKPLPPEEFKAFLELEAKCQGD